MSALPAEAGSYALHLVLRTPQRLQVGALGEYEFPAGEYVYLGSAAGPGGLRARVGRHVRPGKTRHWHIDYLLDYTGLLGLGWTVSPTRLECAWSQALARLPGACVPAPGFGAGDCRARGRACAAHLLAFPAGISAANLVACLEQSGGFGLLEVAYLRWQDASLREAPLR